jgi:hypothetical protein
MGDGRRSKVEGLNGSDGWMLMERKLPTSTYCTVASFSASESVSQSSALENLKTAYCEVASSRSKKEGIIALSCCNLGGRQSVESRLIVVHGLLPPEPCKSRRPVGISNFHVKYKNLLFHSKICCGVIITNVEDDCDRDCKLFDANT